MPGRIDTRLRSPLRWLWTVLSSLAVIAAASLTGFNWLLLGVPVVWIVFLTLPPILVFRHDETPVEHADLALQATAESQHGGYTSFQLSVSNDGDVCAESFSIRLRLPRDLSPPGHIVEPLGILHAGSAGEHWFTETIDGNVILTFRSAGRGAGSIRVKPDQRLSLCELRFANGRVKKHSNIDFQISGGNASTVLGSLTLEGVQQIR